MRRGYGKGADLLACNEWTRTWKSLLEMKRRVGLGGGKA